MDDDDFGGFEAAESYEFGNGEKQTTSPAIAWAAFPTVPEVHRSPDILLEHSVPSSCLVPSDSFILSSDNVATAIQTGKSVINPAVPEEQGVKMFSLQLGEQGREKPFCLEIITRILSEPQELLQMRLT